MRAYKTDNKSTCEALKCLRAWAANWGLPYSVQTDSWPAFCQTWQDELEKVGVSVIHSMVERSVRTLKELLKKNTNLSQLQLSELVENCRENGKKVSAMTRFIILVILGDNLLKI